MPYKTGPWGRQARKRSKGRIQYFSAYSLTYLQEHPRQPRARLGVCISKNIVAAFLFDTELKCSLCKAEAKLLIHHKDKDITNNDFDNLIILCRGCHNKVHDRGNKYIKKGGMKDGNDRKASTRTRKEKTGTGK